MGIAARSNSLVPSLVLKTNSASTLELRMKTFALDIRKQATAANRYVKCNHRCHFLVQSLQNEQYAKKEACAEKEEMMGVSNGHR